MIYLIVTLFISGPVYAYTIPLAVCRTPMPKDPKGKIEYDVAFKKANCKAAKLPSKVQKKP